MAESMSIDIKETNYSYYSNIIKQNINRCSIPMKATVITFGCQQNEADSEKIRGITVDMGYTLSSDYHECDLIIVNTCAIRAHAEMKALSLLGNFKALKKKNPDLVIGICGCMCAEFGAVDILKKDFHYISFTLEPNMLHKIPELVYTAKQGNKRSFIIGQDNGSIVEGMPTVRSSGHRAWVSIMYGCNNFCSYCIVPYVRGRERSRSSEIIIKECCELISSGVKEITLLGQNVNSYRSDMDFASLLRAIAEIDGSFIIRFMTSHPKDVSDGLVAVLKEKSDKIAPYFHLPLQSGSDKILKDMNRTYDSESFLNTVKKLRASVPDIALSTDVIVGFPGETEDDFMDTLEVLRKARFDMGYSFIYSPREGTRAARMRNQVDEETKSRRMELLLKLQDEISYEKNLEYLGKCVRVLVDSVSQRNGNTVYNGRTDTNKLVHFEGNASVGEFVQVKIEKTAAYDLIGRQIN